MTRRRDKYRELVAGRHDDGPNGTVAFFVYTTDLAEGRGDVFVAAGIGLELVARGWGVRFLPRHDWGKRVADGTVAVSMLDDLDVRNIAANALAVAWARNRILAWRDSPALDAYDLILASSALGAREISRRTTTPVGILPIAADSQLFMPRRGDRSHEVVSTVNNWGRERDLHRLLKDADDLDITWYGEQRKEIAAQGQRSAGKMSFFDLPDVYSEALIVLDDVQRDNVPFGCVNSRIFEAIACGAVPITNSALGLSDLGLDEVPVYRSTDDLRRIIGNLRADRAKTTDLALRLREVVQERHTFDLRAEEFLGWVGQIRSSDAAEALTLAYYPDYTRSNPYQSILYAELQSANDTRVVPIEDPTRSVVVRDGGQGLRGYTFHLHWTAPILQAASGPIEACRRLDRFRREVLDLKQRGGTLVWTVHNVLPHECKFRTLEIELARFLTESADVIHILSEATFSAVSGLYELPTAKTRLLPHPSYLGMYPDFVGRDVARARLGVLPGEVALLSLGGIRQYKGINNLIDGFQLAYEVDPRLRLLIAGRPGKFPEIDRWRSLCEQHPRVTSHFDFVDDADVQVWARASDVALLPYSSILNSGSFHLATSFALPVVAPAEGAIRELADERFVRLFEAGSPQSLASAILDAVGSFAGSSSAADASKMAAETVPPHVAAVEFAGLFRELHDDDGPTEGP